MRLFVAALVAGAFAVGAGSALAQPIGIDTARGSVVNADGKALYTADADTAPGKSHCNGPCAGVWPPFSAAADAKAGGDWSVITRDDGSKQWAHKGKPVYVFGRDIPGKPAMGESVLGWKLVKYGVSSARTVRTRACWSGPRSTFAGRSC